MKTIEELKFLKRTRGLKVFLTFALHLLQTVLCLANYLDCLRHVQDSRLPPRLSTYYFFSFLSSGVTLSLFSSVLYMWAWHCWRSEEKFERHLIQGVALFYFLGDVPTLVFTLLIAWHIGIQCLLHGVSLAWTTISAVHGTFRVWTFLILEYCFQKSGGDLQTVPKHGTSLDKSETMR